MKFATKRIRLYPRHLRYVARRMSKAFCVVLFLPDLGFPRPRSSRPTIMHAGGN